MAETPPRLLDCRCHFYGMRRIPPISITRQQLVELLAGEPAQPVGLVTRTPARMRLTDNPYAGRGIMRVADRHGWIGASYESCVNRQRVREGRPKARVSPAEAGVLYVERFRADRLWSGAGEHLPDNRHFVRHKGTGKLYLAFFPLSVLRDLWLDAKQRVIPPAKLEPWLIASGRSSTQQTDKQIQWRVIALENLEILRLKKRVYLISDQVKSQRLPRPRANRQAKAA